MQQEPIRQQGPAGQQWTTGQNASFPQISQEEMMRYFALPKSPKAAIILLVSGALCSIVGLSPSTTVLLIIGIILVVISVILFANLQTRSKLTDQEYDRWLEAQASALVRRSLDKLGLDSNEVARQPWIVRGFTLPGMRDAAKYRSDEVRWKIGKDGVPRYSVNVYTIFCKEDHHLAVYKGDINALNPTAHNENTSEYFYQDIVGVTTDDEQDNLAIKDKQYQYRIQRFTLRVSSGDTVGVSVSATPMDNRQNIPSFNIPNSGIDQTISQLRMLLREKKQR